MSGAPMLPQAIACALKDDSLQQLSDALPACANTACLNAVYLWLNPKTQQLQQRTLLQVAAFHAALDCMAALLQHGADPNTHSPDDGYTALHCACGNATSSSTARAISMLTRFGARREAQNLAGQTPSELLTLEAPQGEGPSGSPDCELTKPEYMTDDFRMHRFKIETCPRLSKMHDWTSCPFQHPGEKARRRDPRLFRYQGVPCPDFRKGVCKRGDTCTFAHGVFECWLHPSRYRTQLCKEGAACRRSVCFFAHAVDQLREPTMLLEDISQPGSPRGPLGQAEDSQDTSRSTSPTPATSEESVHLHSSTDSMRAVFRRARSQTPSADSSVSSTPVMDSGLAAAMQAETLQRSLSTLSLASEDVMREVAHAAALQACAVPNPAAALPLGLVTAPGAAQGWLPMQVPPGADALMFSQLASLGPLAAGAAAMHGMPPLPDTQAAMLQAAAYQQSLVLSMAQQGMQGMDTAALLAAQAAAGMPVGGGQPLNHLASSAALQACFGMQGVRM